MAHLETLDNTIMKCPHCLVSIHENNSSLPIGEDISSRWSVNSSICPSCRKYIISLKEEYDKYSVIGIPGSQYRDSREHQCYPKGGVRAQVPPIVPEKFSDDYKEACLVLVDSPKASAALSRRCLQNILRDVAGVKGKNLAEEIQIVLDSGKIPSHIAESLDGIRNIGNFASHPIKSQASGEIIDVEIGEAEWNLDVLEALFDFYFIQPAVMQKKRDALNVKLREAGKPEMK